MNLALRVARPLVDEFQECQEPLTPGPPMTPSNDFPGRHVQRGKQRSGPTALVVVQATLNRRARERDTNPSRDRQGAVRRRSSCALIC
jgi:hypothetical protein